MGSKTSTLYYSNLPIKYGSLIRVIMLKIWECENEGGLEISNFLAISVIWWAICGKRSPAKMKNVCGADTTARRSGFGNRCVVRSSFAVRLGMTFLLPLLGPPRHSASRIHHPRYQFRPSVCPQEAKRLPIARLWSASFQNLGQIPLLLFQ